MFCVGILGLGTSVWVIKGQKKTEEELKRRIDILAEGGVWRDRTNTNNGAFRKFGKPRNI